jgi:hypothetical protein
LWKEKAYAAAARPEALIVEIVAPQMDEAVAIVRPEALVGQGEVLYAELRIPSRAWIFYLTEVRHSEIVGHFDGSTSRNEWTPLMGNSLGLV